MTEEEQQRFDALIGREANKEVRDITALGWPPQVLTLRSQQRSLAILNVLGGLAVLGSYVLAFAYSPAIRVGLWGGVPDGIRPLYTVSMLLAALGYFPFTYQLVFRFPPEDFFEIVHRRYRILHLVYGLILVPSALWLPLTAEMLELPSAPLWWSIRGVLGMVAVGSTALLVILVVVAVRRGGALAWVSVAGGAAFWVQTAVLDALVWPAYF